MGKYHLIGVKGTGMSALACSLKQMGNDVSGSDVAEDFFTTPFLNENQIEIFPFDIKNITDDKIYIISRAYDDKNIEVKKIFENKLPYYYYHDFINHYYSGTKIGVSGVHGKTTTAKIITSLMEDYSLSAIIGDGTGIGNLDYDYFIFEACEYKNHFHIFSYDYLIINNIDFDHPDFFENLEKVKASFQKVSTKAKVLIINGDDENCSEIMHPHKYTFGFGKENFTKVIKAIETSRGYNLDIEIDNQKLSLSFPFFGKHMIYNFLASLTVYYLIGGNIEKVPEKINKLTLPQRRMEEYNYNDNIIIDDYAHHPTEIKACIAAVKKKYPEKKIVVFFEPHTYSRTLKLASEFKNSFIGVAELYLAKTFTSKREKYNRKLEKRVKNIFSNTKKFNRRTLSKIKKYYNSVIIFMGAGNIRKHIKNILL